MKKSTHNGYRTDLFMPVMKECEGKYIAVLSDNSTDRDDESLSKGCIEKLANDNEYLAALCNHNNDIFMQVAEWTNRGCKEVDGYTALVAEPKFFMSNPNAKIIKGMLDEGAKLGISIGAMVKNYDEINGKRVFTDIELVEASFVAIPSNRHGRAMAVAKSFNRTVEGKKMEKEFTQKDMDSAVEKKVEEVKSDFTKQLETKDTELKDLNKKVEELEKASTEKIEAVEKVSKEFEEKSIKLTEELEKAKKVALEKQQHANQGGDNEPNQEDIEKSFADGKLPIMRGM